ncbi:Protein of unknown function DUF4535 family-containing protein [Strongyloides ratti]|uniref:Uncharacterized protein n=1 Tax=Strongyloides ratti TaxID=34506 RepID=A0A090LE03_STRRB|nr:Protein of unknown function DUF4535 family-containing protein [Strongyloides ratti]CEF68026.1 Protein of unknown function DUF4535 family-containing protein [Strongyloides ratti]
MLSKKDFLMGVFSNLLFLTIGGYSGVYISQNYRIPQLHSPTELIQIAKEYYKKFEEIHSIKKKNDET